MKGIVALTFALVLCSACAQALTTPRTPATPTLAPPSGSLPWFEITTTKPGDHISFRVEDGIVHFEISSPGGIGGARIVRVSESAPKEFVLDFRLRGLEHLKFTFGDQFAQVEIPSSGDHIPISSAAPGSELELPVRLFSRNDAYPIQEGYIQVQPPRAFYTSGLKEFAIEWIDFYR